MSAPTSLLFDLDGTLTDNFVGISTSIRHALARLELPAPDDAMLRTCVGPPLRETFGRLLATKDSSLIERAVMHYRERYAEIGWRENTMYDGIPATLATLAADARLLLCSAKPEPFARRIVEHFGLASHFSGIYAPDLDGALDDKAALVAHLLTVERIAPAAAVMIGDRANDIRAARANGVRAVGVTWGYGTRAELAHADALVETPARLVDLLRWSF